MPDDTRYVLRLVVVKMEGVLVPGADTLSSLLRQETNQTFDADNLFPTWSESLGIPTDTLRNRLAELARTPDVEVEDEIKGFLDELRNHTPVRVALLSGGPTEWVKTLEQQNELEDLNDLIFCYDDYSHGSRRTLLQFLMNRFIAGKGRTLFLGNTVADEQMAAREQTRFRSFSDPPDTALHPEQWNWSLPELRSYVHQIKAEE